MLKPDILTKLLNHINECPIGWQGGDMVLYRDTTTKQIVEWVKKLTDLGDAVRDRGQVSEIPALAELNMKAPIKGRKRAKARARETHSRIVERLRPWKGKSR